MLRIVFIFFAISLCHADPLRKQELARLENRVGNRAANLDDETSPIWISNSYRLTPEEYHTYKQELLNIATKYTRLAERNCLRGVDHCVVWVVQLADRIDPDDEF